ncbi:hypothetical protein PBT90_05330 [Algoriphagus halophytocola]|uniref:DUF1593 domain-containing protein n=1 Tax=Algoriphagus halophytocola TaxID=2991499 RepID=A0ABY6MKV7_9BACT|nr:MULTISPECIES: hypothetical protein [unclassified Algoriphagus]UZD22839.1 hypothetical protein OM944_19590 [Algoriphagus sp. TR-M5]WBL44106.1 hypothetical protein PBT90_05330 [Algoriphagus sp. TR-M9]
MKRAGILFTVLICFLVLDSSSAQAEQSSRKAFDKEKDLLLVNLDCKTDVDDIHTAAAFATLLHQPAFANLKYHVVAGTYGVQEGLYVPPNELLELAFKNSKWSDAHADQERALRQVMQEVKKVLKNQADIWIAEAGQSDFTAKLVKNIQRELPAIEVATRIHVVQHSNWNEEVTSAAALSFVKNTVDYHKIPDGNAEGNGTPGFRTPEYQDWKDEVSNPRLLEVWRLAVKIGLEYNGKDGRYNNEAVGSGGLDFSDLSEVCWILGLEDIEDTQEFFERFGS